MTHIIIANAKPIQLAYIEKHKKDRKIIALDGVANFLKDENLIPDIIIGDFDSIHSSSEEYFSKLGVNLIKILDQNSTDLDKAIKYSLKDNASEIIILNAFGGKRLDHGIINTRMLRKHYSKQARIKIIEHDGVIEYINDQSCTVKGACNDDFAIMAFPDAYVTSKGLKYEMNNYHLNFGFSESSSNSLATEEAKIEVKGEAIIIYKLDNDVKITN